MTEAKTAHEQESREDHVRKNDVYASAFLTIQEISVPDQEFTITGYFNVFWRDPEVARFARGRKAGEWECPQYLVPWQSTNLFDNSDDEEFREKPKFYYNEESSVVHMIYNVRARHKENMELGRFPYDRQFLNIVFTGMRENWIWLAECPDWVPESIVEEATWDIPLHVRLSESLTSHYRLYSSYVDYARQPFMRYRFRVERRLGFYLVNLVLPMFLIVAICFSSISIPRADVADRLSISVTMFLAAVAYQYVVSSMLPTTSTVSILSAYVMASYAMIALVVVDNVLGGLLTDESGRLLDILALGVLGGLWCALNLLLVCAEMRICPCLSLRLSWERVSVADDDASYMWEHIDMSETSLHSSRRWILPDPRHTTMLSDVLARNQKSPTSIRRRHNAAKRKSDAKYERKLRNSQKLTQADIDISISSTGSTSLVKETSRVDTHSEVNIQLSET